MLTFLAFNTLIFLIAHLLQEVSVSIGVGLSMFAIFRMLRYRILSYPPSCPPPCIARGRAASFVSFPFLQTGKEALQRNFPAPTHVSIHSPCTT
ncbi:MAG: DUF4956 domain-containing protein [Anaerolineae bacterium]